MDALNEHLLRVHATGRRTVLIIDEAQNLSREVLEQVRLLTNLETTKHKLLRIILVGQPELRALLARPDLRQLAQRITCLLYTSSAGNPLPGNSKCGTAPPAIRPFHERWPPPQQIHAVLAISLGNLSLAEAKHGKPI